MNRERRGRGSKYGGGAGAAQAWRPAPGKVTRTAKLTGALGAASSRGGGQALDRATRSQMERAFGTDFSAVRVHQDESAAETGALAYAQGADLHFAPGQYDPHSRAGLEMIGHELAHVVQQSQGRVKSPAQGKGLPVNDDPSLEREADKEGARAARGEPVAMSAPPVATPAGEVAQMLPSWLIEDGYWYRVRYGDHPPRWYRLLLVCHDRGWYLFVNSHGKKYEITNAKNIDKRIAAPSLPTAEEPDENAEAGDDDGARAAQSDSESEAKGNGTATIQEQHWYKVRRKGNAVQRLWLHEHEQGRYHFKDLNWKSVWITNKERIGERGEGHPPLIPGTSDTTQGPHSARSEGERNEKGKEIDREGEDVAEAGERSSTSTQTFSYDNARDSLKDIYDVSKLITNFTANVALFPLNEGTLRADDQSRRYPPEHIWVQTINVSDDRSPTQFPRQESHTVDWSLLREATMKLAGRTVADLFALLQMEFDTIRSFAASDEAQALIGEIGFDDVSRIKDSLGVDTWQRLICRLLRIYTQVYHISTMATYRRGRATYHGEGHHVEKLRNADQNAAQGHLPSPDDLTELSNAARKLLDVQFHALRLSPKAYAFAVQHWLDSLWQAFPNLMDKCHEEIAREPLELSLPPSFKSAVASEKVGTVRDLLLHFEHSLHRAEGLAEWSYEPVGPGSLRLPDLQLGRLTTHFVADVAIVRKQEERSQRKEWTVRATRRGHQNPASENTFEVEACDATQLQVQTITLSRSRPKTQFRRGQKSHTVPWSDMLSEVETHSNGPLSDLLLFLSERFIGLAKDIADKDGKRIVARARELITTYADEILPLHDWPRLVNELIRCYFVAYQVSKSASYVNPAQLDRALGNAEGHHGRRLREAQVALRAGEKPMCTDQQLVASCVNRFDVYRTATLDEEGLVKAYERWWSTLTRLYPDVMMRVGPQSDEAIQARRVAGDKTMGDLLATERAKREGPSSSSRPV